MSQKPANTAWQRALVAYLDQNRISTTYILAGTSTEDLTREASLLIRSHICPKVASQVSLLQGVHCTCHICMGVLGGQNPAFTVYQPTDKGWKVEQLRAIQKTCRSVAPKPFRLMVFEKANEMSQQCSEALLKFLEEPPPNTVIILEAKTAFSFPKTIKSRCLIFYTTYTEFSFLDRPKPATINDILQNKYDIPQLIEIVNHWYYSALYNATTKGANAQLVKQFLLLLESCMQAISLGASPAVVRGLLAAESGIAERVLFAYANSD